MISLPSVTSKARTALLGIVFAASTVAGVGYHLLGWSAGQKPGGLVEVVFHAIVALGYGSLWMLALDQVARRRVGAARTFWSLSLVAAGAIAASVTVLLLARPPAAPEGVDPRLLLGFDLETRAPIVLATVFKMNALGIIQGMFSVALLVRLRNLVLVKRTRSSQRNWNVMIGLMAVTALATAFTPAGTELNELQTIGLIAAFVFMVVNSFRLSWIVTLGFRQKMVTAGLSLILLVTLVTGIGVMNDSPLTGSVSPGAYAYVEQFSYPLSMFSSQAAMFGILYCATTLLSLLFHLPTTGEFQQRAGERAAMHSLTHLVGEVFDAPRLYAAISRSPVEAGCAHAAWLAVPDPASGSMRPRIVAAHPVDPARIEELVDHEALYDDLIAQRTPLVLDHAMADRRVKARASDGIGSLVAAPLLVRDRVLGVLVASKDVVMGFERDEIEIIGILAAQAALAIENSRLFEQQVERERMARELSIAREVQRRLLPQTLPSMDGLSIAASSVSAQEVGGDYYDFVRLSENRLGFIIADVSGKGTSAAFYMAEMQGIFQSASRLAPSPTEFLTHANLALGDSLEPSVFITAIYGVVDVAAETLSMARAGHCPAAVVNVTGKATYVRSGGMGLGLDRGDLFRKSIAETTIRLQPGDVVAFCTDGVVESRSASNGEFGYERLLDAVARNRFEDVREIHEAVLRELTTFIGEKEYDDDMTLVILKWHGLPADLLRGRDITGEGVALRAVRRTDPSPS